MCINLINFNFILCFRHEVDVHNLNLDSGPGEKDTFGFVKCRANCGYVFTTKATRKLYVPLKIVMLYL